MCLYSKMKRRVLFGGVGVCVAVYQCMYRCMCISVCIV